MRERQVGEVLILTFETALPSAQPELDQAIEMVGSALRRGHVRIVVNLEEVEVMKALTLGLLKNAAQKCREREGHLVVCCAQRHILDVLKMTHLDELFMIRDSENDALACLAELGRT